MKKCRYISASNGIHDKRWIAALETLGYEVLTEVRNQFESDVEFRNRIKQLQVELSLPMIAGPLNTITIPLLGIDKLIGLSWGYDLHTTVDENLSGLATISALIVDSMATMEIALAVGVCADRIFNIPWGIELNNFEFQNKSLTNPYSDSGSKILLTLRAHEKIYRVEDILAAFKLILRSYPQSVLIIGNEGSLTEELQDIARDLDLKTQVKFVGTIAESDLSRYLSYCDVYISAAEVDGSSVTLLQAMAVGAPIVAAASAGNLEWISDDVSGFTFPIGNQLALARAIEKELAEPSLTRCLNARRTVETKADWNRNFAQVSDAITLVQ